jgi:Family of unknown function (DUF6011)
MSSARLSQQKARAYILAGKSTVIFHNIATDNVRRFYVYKKTGSAIWQVKPLDFTVKEKVGYITGHLQFISYPGPFDRNTDNSYVRAFNAQVDAFSYMWRHIMSETVPENIHILHPMTCGYCGKTLTDPVSIECGIGPVCRGKLKTS